jgi:hypothetical protein
MSLSSEEVDLAERIGFDREVCELLKSYAESDLHQLMAFDDNWTLQPAEGVSATVERSIASRIAPAMQPILVPQGYRAFWTDAFDERNFKSGDEIAIIKSMDPYAPLRLRQSNGANHDVSTDDIIARLHD